MLHKTLRTMENNETIAEVVNIFVTIFSYFPSSPSCLVNAAGESALDVARKYKHVECEDLVGVSCLCRRKGSPWANFLALLSLKKFLSCF